MNAPERPTDAARSALLTDLYQLTMLQAYESAGMRGEASFELFFRRLPARRGFVMAAGLEPALDWLETMRFRRDELDWLTATGRFKPELITMLRTLRFTGEVAAVPEGTIVFPGEPILRVTAPIAQAQFVESRLLNLIHAHSLIASKAARCVLAAPDTRLIEFGLRRAHGAEAAMIAARASVIAGFDASANVLAGRVDGIALAGTMAHSFVLAHEAEALAFEHFGEANPGNVAFVIDTYDIEQGAHRAVAAAEQLARSGIRLQAVRIDSGDLAMMSRRVRAILDSAGLQQVRILASGDLDEWRIAALRAAGSPIDAFCIGTALSTSADAPSIDFAYKLVEYEGRACAKRSPDKATLPGRKQVWRRHGPQGWIDADVITRDDEPAPSIANGVCALTGGPGAAMTLNESRLPATSMVWQPLMATVMRAGRRVRAAPSLESIRQHAAAQLRSLPPGLRTLSATGNPPVRFSERLRADAAALHQRATDFSSRFAAITAGAPTPRPRLPLTEPVSRRERESAPVLVSSHGQPVNPPMPTRQDLSRPQPDPADRRSRAKPRPPAGIR